MGVKRLRYRLAGVAVRWHIRLCRRCRGGALRAHEHEEVMTP